MPVLKELPAAGGCIRELRRGELDIAVAWAAAEGWNPGDYDADVFHATDPHGFYGVEIGTEIIATMSNVRYDEKFSFAGFYIVKPEYRGKGLGLELFTAALEACDAACTGLDGVVEQEANYKKSGFETAYHNIRFRAQGGGTMPASVVPAQAVSAERLLQLDTHCFPTARDSFLRQWLEMPNARSFIVPAEGEIAGLGTIRSCREGFKIGPLLARDPDTAETLYRALAAQAPDAPVYLDPPEVNAEAMALCERHGMDKVFETVRMYRGPAPDLPADLIYGVTSFELG
jgi:GNAT superfamily N-acetyltransferase